MTTVLAAWVSTCNRIIIAVRKHIIPEEALAGAAVGVRVQEALDDRIIVSGLQVIEARFGIVVVGEGSLCCPCVPAVISSIMGRSYLIDTPLYIKTSVRCFATLFTEKTDTNWASFCRVYVINKGAGSLCSRACFRARPGIGDSHLRLATVFLRTKKHGGRFLARRKRPSIFVTCFRRRRARRGWRIGSPSPPSGSAAHPGSPRW